MSFREDIMKYLFFILYLLTSTFLFATHSLDLPATIDHIPQRILQNIKENEKDFLVDLEDVLKDDVNDLFILVDKNYRLDNEFVPYELVELKKGASYDINKKGLKLTPMAEKALDTMAKVAKKEGVSLLVSSTYRTYEYQNNLFTRYTKEYGEQEADRFSARPWASQHRLGTVIDFGSISDDYATTKAGKWLNKKAYKYGWSLSYPKGYEKITGYKWECWHFRYLGIKACKFQKKYFEDIQQYMLEFIHYWKNKKSS